MTRSWRRLFPALVIMLLTAALLRARQRPEFLPPHQQLSNFPMQMENWSGSALSLTPGQLAVLGPGEFLFRDYRRSPMEPPVNLYVAYFPSQRTGDTIHSPKNCLPGAGWVPDESSHLSIQSASGAPVVVNRYIVSKGMSRALVFYWYQAHGRVTPSEYWAKVYLVSDAIRMNRTDGALVRVVTEISPGTGEAAAEKVGLEFTNRVLPILDNYIPR